MKLGRVASNRISSATELSHNFVSYCFVPKNRRLVLESNRPYLTRGTVMRFSFDFTETGQTGVTIAAAERIFSFQEAISKLEGETDTTSSGLSEGDIYNTMFSDSTRGDISPSDLGSGEGSGDEDFTVFNTNFFSTDEGKSESPASGTEGKTGTTEFGTEVTESSDITEGTDVTFEGSGTTIEEGSGTSPEEGSSASTDMFSETTVAETESSAASTESGSTFLLIPKYIFLL